MKKKLLCVTVILAACLIAIIANWHVDNTRENMKTRVHQHLEAESAEELPACSHKSSRICTHLPLVSIDTRGRQLSEKRESKIFCDIRIWDEEGKRHHLTDTPDIETASQINIRGASSRHFDKHSYRLEFRENKNPAEKKNLSIMGMESDCDWILYGPWLDKSLLRNYMMYNLSGEIMEWAPDVRYCEVFLNGEYQGLYVMTESIEVDEDRLPLREYDDRQTETSYLIERNRVGSTDDPINTFGGQAGYTEYELGILYPKALDMTGETRRWIIDNINEMEKLLYSYDYDEWDYGYYNFLDVDSFVDYALINEVSANLDAGSLSTYAYKPLGGKLTMGPVWDFNNAFGLYEIDPQDFFMQDSPWFFMLYKDETFVNRLISRYQSLRKTWFDEEYLMNYIDETIRFLGPAIDRNFDKWGYSFNLVFFDDPNRELRSYQEAIAQLKDFIEDRLEFMDENIEVLHQYCHESMVKSYN